MSAIAVDQGRLGLVRVSGLADAPQVLDMLAEVACSASGAQALERFVEAVRARDEVPGEDHPDADAAERELDEARADLQSALAPHLWTDLPRRDAGVLGAALYGVLTPSRSAA